MFSLTAHRLNLTRLLCFAALAGLTSCSDLELDGGETCVMDADCSSGSLCLKSISTCTTVVNDVPDLEVLPPNINNQGWVVTEYNKPGLNAQGRLKLRLAQAISLEGSVFASDSQGKVVPARITATRASLLPGRPQVQVTTTTNQGNQDPTRAEGSYLLWLTQGQEYTFLVSPIAPYDLDYPPLVVKGLRLNDHLKRNFVLEGKDRTVKVTGKVLDATGNDLPDKVLADPNVPIVKGSDAHLLRATVRVRAYQTGGLHLSTLGATDPDAKDRTKKSHFSFRVPAGGTMPTGGLTYTLRVESVSGGIPVPTVTCDKLFLGIYSGATPEQVLGDLRLPAFRLPKYYTIKVNGKDGTAAGMPVAGATVKFSMSFSSVPSSLGYTDCTATYERTGITKSDGTVQLPLIPGTDSKNQKYSVTITSPNSSPYAGAVMGDVEVGPSAGVLASLELAPRFKLTGRVITSAKKAVAGALVEARGIAPQGGAAAVGSPTASTSTTTDAEGAFSLAVEAGRYNFQVQPPQGKGLPAFSIPSKSISGDLGGVLFQVPAAQVLAGEVEDPTGRVLTSAKVSVYELVHDTDQTKRAELRASDITDKAGTFSLLLPASK